MRDHSAHIELSRDEAVRRMLERLKAPGFNTFGLLHSERAVLDRSYGRVLAYGVCPKADVADIIVFDAGSSKGFDDRSVEMLEDMCEIICHQANHGQGHHSSSTLTSRKGRLVPVVGISGPTGGESFAFDFYLRPIVKLFPRLDPDPIRLSAMLVGSFGSNRFWSRFSYFEDLRGVPLSRRHPKRVAILFRPVH